ncbi:MAG: rod shape-determining protein RodA [Candidatus Eisenbacteria bacterium]
MKPSQRSLVIALVALGCLGIFAVYSSTRTETGASYAVRQAIWTGLGIAVMFAVSMIRVKTLSSLAPVAYFGAIVLLALVLVIGKGPHGTRRWFDLGLMRFQPSEIAKIATIFMVSRYLSDKGAIGQSLKSVLVVFAMVALPAALIVNEPDLGTALVFGFIALPMLYASGLDPLYLLFLVSPFFAIVAAGEIVAWVIFVILLVIVMVLRKFRTSLVALVFGMNFMLYSLAPRFWSSLAPYQRDRVLAFLHPDSYRHSAGFQIIQSQIAIGSGGFTGKGIFKGTQKALGLVPAQHTDFVFSLVGEEMGFIGGLAVLLLLGYVVTRIFGVARVVRNRFAMFFCFGFGSLILIQVFVNIGMTLGLTPVTGLPLPYLSYGGSQTIIFWGTAGAVLAAHASKREY